MANGKEQISNAKGLAICHLNFAICHLKFFYEPSGSGSFAGRPPEFEGLVKSDVASTPQGSGSGMRRSHGTRLRQDMFYCREADK